MTQDECKNLDELIATLVKYHPEANVELVEKAYRFAEKAHAGQLRKSGEPYFVHPLTVAGILAKLMLSAACALFSAVSTAFCCSVSQEEICFSHTRRSPPVCSTIRWRIATM